MYTAIRGISLFLGFFGAFTAQAQFQVEHVRGIYSVRSNAKTKVARKSSTQRKLSVGSVLALQEGTFDESQAQLVLPGVQLSLLGGSTVELSGVRSLRRWAGALRVQVSAKAKPFVVRLVSSKVAEPLSVQCSTLVACDWIVFERPVEPMAGKGAQDPEIVVVILRGQAQLTRWQRGDQLRKKAQGQKTEILQLRERDQYAHSLYSGGTFSPRALPPGEAEAFYRQWGWEP